MYNRRVPEVDGISADRIRAYKYQKGVPIQFDQVAIVDDIDAGLDSYDNYSAAQLCVLLMEREDRAARKELDGGRNLGRASRYSWYDMRRISEYARFIDNRYYASTLSGFSRYTVDPSFWVISSDSVPHVLPSKPSAVTGDPDTDIAWDMVDVVAEEMATVSMRLREIRERLKLQTRKNYMKGTNNLIVLAINEYLRDYGRYAKVPSDISSVMANLAGYGLSGIDVLEYLDYTEYFNICCDTSISSRSGLNGVNPRFWADGAIDRDGMDFTKT